MKTDLSVIILNWNTKQYIDSCLGSVLKTMPMTIKSEIILIDNGSRDGSIDHIKKNYKDAIVIENKNNNGVGPARNQGLAIAKGEYILILDIDIVVHDGAIDALLKTMKTDSAIGLCGPKLVGENGNLQYSCRGFPTILSKLYRQFPGKWQFYLLKKEEYRDWEHDSV